MQVSIGTKGANQQEPKQLDLADLSNKNGGSKSATSGPGTSGTNSNLNVYLRHNAPSRAGKKALEPVKLATQTGLQQIIQLQQQDGGGDKTGDQGRHSVAYDSSNSDAMQVSKRIDNEYHISKVLNQEEFQHLGQQPLSLADLNKNLNQNSVSPDETRTFSVTGQTQKMYQQSSPNGENYAIQNKVEGGPDNGQSLQHNRQAQVVDERQQNINQEKQGRVEPAGVSNPSNQTHGQPDAEYLAHLQKQLTTGQIKDPSQLARIMKELNPAISANIISPPVGLIIQSEDQQLFELYQLQSQELMRIANEGLAMNTPPTHSKSPNVLDNQDGTQTPTQEQAQQVAMPELQFNDDPLFSETMQFGATKNAMTFGMLAGAGKASMAQHEQHQMLEPKLTSMKEISRYMDQSTLSQQTISVPDISGLERISQVNNQPSLQKITLPAFSVANFGKQSSQEDGMDTSGRETGDFKDKIIKNAVFSNNSGNGIASHPRREQVILGMMDSLDDKQADSPCGAVFIGTPKLNSGQQVQWVRVPKPQQPVLIEKNAIGGGGKYVSQKKSPVNAATSRDQFYDHDNQPTFPAFFTKTAQQQNQQMKTKHSEAGVGAADQRKAHDGSLAQMKQMHALHDGRLTSNELLPHKNNNLAAPEGHKGGGISLTKNKARKKRRNTYMDQEPRSRVFGSEEDNREPGDPNNDNQYRPIRVQSVLAPYQESSELRESTLIPLLDKSSLQPRGPSNYKVSYLNRPSATLKATLSANQTTSPAALRTNRQQTLSDQKIAARTHGATINQDSKISFKDYIEFQSKAELTEAAPQSTNVSARNRSKKDKHTGSIDNSSPASCQRQYNLIDSRHPSLNNTFVPRLQALKPKRLLEADTNLNGKNSSMSKLRRITMMDDKMASSRNQSLMHKTTTSRFADSKANQKLEGFKPINKRLKSLNQASSRSQLGAKNTTTIRTVKQLQQEKQTVIMAMGKSAFTGRTSPSYGPDSTLEVIVVKQDASQALPEQSKVQTKQKKSAKEDKRQEAVQDQQTMHFGGKFKVNIHKRSSTNTITESQTMLNNNNQSKEGFIRKKSQLSTVTAQAPVITPKYFATIQAITANERKQLNVKRSTNNTSSHHNEVQSPIGGGGVDTALQRSYADEETISAIQGLVKNSSEAQTALDHHNHQTPAKQMLSQTQQQMQIVSSLSKDTEPIASNNIKTLMSITANQNTFRRENAASIGSNLSHHSQSPWRRKKTKIGQPPVLTAEHIVQRNIGPYERGDSNKKQKSSDQKMLQQANAQGIVLGLPKKLSEAGMGRNSMSNNHTAGLTQQKNLFLPELGVRRKSGMNVIESQISEHNQITTDHNSISVNQRVDIELQTAQMKNSDSRNIIMNADLIERAAVGGQEEIDSILSPEYLRLVNNQSELHTERPDAALPDATGGPSADHTSAANNPMKQERRQVIKILDQSKWRHTAASPAPQEYEQQNSLLNLAGDTQMLPITPILGGGMKTHTSSTADQKKRKNNEAKSKSSTTNNASSKHASTKRGRKKDLNQVLQEGSLHMGSMFDHKEAHGDDSRLSMIKTVTGAGSTFQKTKGRKSQLTYNQDIKVQGTSSIMQPSLHNYRETMQEEQDQMIEQSVREMKELMARETLMQDDVAGNSSIDHPNFDTNEPDHANFMNSTEYSQFIHHNDAAEGSGNNVALKQDFNGQIQVGEYDHLYQTMGNLNNQVPGYNGQIEMSTIPERMNSTKNQGSFLGSKKRFYSPKNTNLPISGLNDKLKHPLLKLSPKQKQGAQETVHIYPVGIHSRLNKLSPIEKLKVQLNAQKQIALQRQRFNSTVVDSKNQRKSSILGKNTVIPETGAEGSGMGAARNTATNFSSQNQGSLVILMTQTRFSQHQRALSELRQIQRQIHLDGQEQSPPMPRASPRGLPGSKKVNPVVVTQALSVKKQPAKERTVSPRKQKQIAERQQRLQKLKQQADQQQLQQQKDAKNDDVRTIEAKSDREMASTQMGKHSPVDEFNLVSAEKPAKAATKQQPVIVNTSGSNTAYLPSPNHAGSPILTSANATVRQVQLGPPYAIQQTKLFGPVIFDKSVLPQQRIYHYNARGGLTGSKDQVNKDIIDACPTQALNGDYVHERAGSSIIANYQKQSQLDVDVDHSPKSYKMPANFPHGIDSQVDSMQGGAPDSASGGGHHMNLGKAPHLRESVGTKKDVASRMPVHSFTTQAQQDFIGARHHHDRQFHKIQSSKVNHRRHILAEKNAKTGSKLKDQFIGEVLRGESIELVQTLRMKKQPTKQDGALVGDVLPLSFENSVDQMPERYEVENDSLQNINQVQDLLDVVEKEKEENLKAGDLGGIETVVNSRGQGSIDFEQIQANIEAAQVDTPERETPDMAKSVVEHRALVEKSMLLSSAQTLEAEVSSPEVMRTDQQMPLIQHAQ